VVGSFPASAYYHYTHYLNGARVPERFDLSALNNKTVNVFVSESGPQTYSATDTFNSVVSQVRQAVAVWNGVSSSDLRLAFGGFENAATIQNTPGVDVVFEDLPPGLYGYGGPTIPVSKANPTTVTSGAITFVPITRSAVHLNRNLTLAPGPSYQETFFMTVVHEMGHSLGLQHTFTSSTMSQATTRATNLSHPLDNDDIAGISVLYPNANFAQFGSISGRVTAGGQGVHMASVVAIRPGSGAVSALTSPDGSFRIDGIPPGQYFLYAHALPPDADIVGPWNIDGSVAAPSGPVNALFFPGTAVAAQAAAIPVMAGQVTTTGGGLPITIATTARPAVTLYDDVIYSYYNNTIPMQPGFVDIQAGNNTVVASGYGLGSNGQAPGLGVQFIGNSVTILPNGIRPYQTAGYTYVALDLGIPLGTQTGPQHIIFSTPSELYVLPSALSLTQNLPPSVSAATPNGDGTVSVYGSNWTPDTHIFFDGLPATVNAINAAAGGAVVQPPPGASGQQATVSAYNKDGQNSQLIQATASVTYAYGTSAAPAIISVSPASLPAGSEAVVDIAVFGLNLAQATPAVGFGTSDILVRHIFVQQNHVLADVSVGPGASLSATDVSVFLGFQMATASSVFQITAPVPGLPTPIPDLTNAVSGLTGAYPGSIVSLYGANLGATAAPTVTVGGLPVSVLYASANQLNLQLPPSLTPGPAQLTLNTGAANAYPIEVNVDSFPASINAIQYASGNYVDTFHPIHVGDAIIITLSNFAPAGSTIDPSRVQVSVGGVLHAPYQVSAVGSVYQVSFLMNATDPTGSSEPVIVYLDGRSSYPATVPVAHTDGTFN
jgi:uncharacterized protein (TIGR03437 family)